MLSMRDRDWLITGSLLPTDQGWSLWKSLEWWFTLKCGLGEGYVEMFGSSVTPGEISRPYADPKSLISNKELLAKNIHLVFLSSSLPSLSSLFLSH